MGDEPEAAAQGTSERLAAVCAHLEEIRSDLLSGPGGDDAPVEQALAAARGAGDISGPLAALHAILQASGDPQGLDGYTGTGGSSRSVRPVGIGSDRLAERVYLCPESRCTRYWWPQGPAAVPRCAVSGTALRLDRL